MIDIKRILFPVDFSKYTDKVFPYVLFLAEKHHATVYLLHVAHDLRQHAYAGPDSPKNTVSRWMEELVKTGEKTVERALDETSSTYPDFQYRVLAGEPVEEIVKIIKEEKIDLVVMGTHGRKGLSRTLFGSVVEYVARSAPVPVLTINPLVEHCS